MGWGIPEALAVQAYNINGAVTPMDYVNNDAFQAGRAVGNAASVVAGAVETANGVIMIAEGIAAMGFTAGGGALCTAASGGACAIPTGAALTAEGAVVVAGAVETAHGVGVMFAAAKAQSSLPGQNKGSTKGRPGNNIAQNRQFNGAVREIEKQLGRSLSKTERRMLHDSLHYLEDPGYWDIVDEGLNLFDMGAE